jgi:hypothetical protein
VSRRLRLALAGAAIAVGVAIAHGGDLGAEFVAWDDDVYVTRNPMVFRGLTAEGIRWAFAPGAETASYFHPLSWLSLQLDAQLFGTDPRAFHAVNLALHAATAILLFLLLERATGRLAAALLSALLFALHPVTVEAVAWVTERKTVLSSALGMGALLAWLAAAERPSLARRGAAWGLFALSLMAKPGLVVLPLLFLLLEAWPLGRLPLARGPEARAAWRGAALRVAPLLAIGAATTLLVVASMQGMTRVEWGGPSLPFRLVAALASIAWTVKGALWPAGLGILHAYPTAWPVGAALAGAALLVGGAAAGAAVARRAPWVPFGACWFLVALLPYLGILQAGLWPAWAERFAYFPLAGLAVVVGFTVAEAARSSTKVLAVAGAALLVPLSAATRVQSGTWLDSTRLFRRGVEVAPGAYKMHFGLGKQLAAAGRFAEAEASLRRASELDPASSPARTLLAMVLDALGRPLDAEAAYREALRLDETNMTALFNLAGKLWEEGRREEARALYGAYLRQAPADSFRERRTAEVRIDTSGATH